MDSVQINELIFRSNNWCLYPILESLSHTLHSNWYPIDSMYGRTFCFFGDTWGTVYLTVINQTLSIKSFQVSSLNRQISLWDSQINWADNLLLICNFRCIFFVFLMRSLYLKQMKISIWIRNRILFTCCVEMSLLAGSKAAQRWYGRQSIIGRRFSYISLLCVSVDSFPSVIPSKGSILKGMTDIRMGALVMMWALTRIGSAYWNRGTY